MSSAFTEMGVEAFVVWWFLFSFGGIGWCLCTKKGQTGSFKRPFCIISGNVICNKETNCALAAQICKAVSCKQSLYLLKLQNFQISIAFSSLLLQQYIHPLL